MSNALPLPCGPGDTPDDPSREPCADQRGTLVATIIGSSLAFVVGSIINVALPQMQSDFSVGPTGAQWIVNAYLLPLSALVLIGGALGDHYGRKTVFIAGLGIFAVACLICALAWSFPVLILGRVLEGVGAALLAPTSLAILADSFTGKERGAAIGTWAAAGAAAGAAAPLIGGVIVDVANWRWAFVAIVPIAGFAILVAQKSVRQSVADPEETAPLDWRGAALSFAGLMALVWGLIALPEQGGTFVVILSIAAGIVFLCGFVFLEHRLGAQAMTPLALFSNRTFSGLSLFTLFLYAALAGLLVLLPYALISDHGYSATAAGAAILPFPLTMGILSRAVGGTLTARFGTRTLLVAGSGLVGLGFAALTLMPSEGLNYWTTVLPALLLVSVGMTACVAPLTTAVLNSAGARYTGVASGVNNAISRIAGLIATALIGLVLIGSAEDLTAGLAAAAWVGVGLAAMSLWAAFALVDQKA